MSNVKALKRQLRAACITFAIQISPKCLLKCFIEETNRQYSSYKTTAPLEWTNSDPIKEFPGNLMNGLDFELPFID